PDAVRVRHQVEGETLRRDPREDRAVGEVDGSRGAEPAVPVAGERPALRRDGERAGVVEARAVPGTDRPERQAPELPEAGEQRALVRLLAPGLGLRRAIRVLEAVRPAAAAPEHAGLPGRGPVLVMDAQDGELRDEHAEQAEPLAVGER